MLFPEPAAKRGVHKITEATGKNKRTLPVNPQQRASQLPVFKLVAVQEPFRGSLMLTITGDVVIRGRIRWRLPFPKAFP